MRSLQSRRDFLRIGVGGGLLWAAGCGTILHPERRGQPAGKLDWTIVALDAVGLLFFFVPGVIAFAVDFATGTIYLPAEHCISEESGSEDARLVALELPEDERTRSGIERAVSRSIGRTVDLESEDCRTRPLENVDEFWSVHDGLRDGTV
ncbi:MAG: hypothetical protein WD066_03705 [Planctomycetaceae bacterium]